MPRSATLMEQDLALIRSPGFAADCATEPRWFTRRRKLTCDRLVRELLCRRGLSMELDMRLFARSTGTARVSASAMCQARMKLDPRAVAALNDHHVSGFHSMADGESGIRLFAGRVVLGIDGSSVIVPSTPRTLDEFGTCSSHGRATAEAGISCMYDLLNDYVVDLSVHRCKFNEQNAAIAHPGRLGLLAGRPCVLVMDRGYGGLPLMISLDRAGVGFAIRMRSANFRVERALVDGGDGWTDVRCDLKARLAPWKGRPEHGLMESAGSLRLRFTDIGEDADGVPVTICSNLPDDEFDTDGMRALYRLRWRAETAFRVLKDNLQLGNFTGIHPRIIRQDIHAAAYLANLAADLAADAAEQGLPSAPYPVAVNRAYAIGVLKQELVLLLTEPDPGRRRRMLEAMGDEIRAHVCPIRPDRHYARNRNLRAGRHHNTHKRCY